MLRILTLTCVALAEESQLADSAEHVSMLQLLNRHDKLLEKVDPLAFDVVGNCAVDSDSCLQHQLHWKDTDICEENWIYCVSGIESGDARWAIDMWECCPKTCTEHTQAQQGKPGNTGKHRRRWQPTENSRRRKWDSHRRRWNDRHVSLNYAIDKFKPPCMQQGSCGKSADTCMNKDEDSDVCLRHQKGWEANEKGIHHTCANSHEFCIGDKERTFDMLKCCPGTCSRAFSPQWEEAPAMQTPGACAASHEACSDDTQDSDFCLHHRRGNHAYCHNWKFWCRDRGSKGADVRDCCPMSCKEKGFPDNTEERTRRRESQRRRTASGGHNAERRRRTRNPHKHEGDDDEGEDDMSHPQDEPEDTNPDPDGTETEPDAETPDGTEPTETDETGETQPADAGTEPAE